MKSLIGILCRGLREVIGLAVLSSLAVTTAAFAAGTAAPTQDEKGWQVERDPVTGFAIGMRGKNSEPYTESSDVAARKFIAEFKGLFGIATDLKDLVLVTSPNSSPTDLRFQQMYNSLPVGGAEVSIHFNTQKQIFLAQSSYAAAACLDKAPKKPKLDKKKVVAIAAAKYKGFTITDIAGRPMKPSGKATVGKVSLLYMKTGADTYVCHLAYEVEFGEAIFYIDAEDGKVLGQRSMSQS